MINNPLSLSEALRTDQLDRLIREQQAQQLTFLDIKEFSKIVKIAVKPPL